jgi:hypothetical protein
LHNVKNYNLLSLIFFVLVGISFSSCSKDQLAAQIPAYIVIDHFSLTTNYLTQGSESENITDAWVYINDDLIGVYTLPAEIPVLAEGSRDLKIYAGVKENGIGSTRVRYLLYTFYNEDVTFVSGETLTINPEITYNSSAQFAWLEDFENASLPFTYDANSDTIINKSTSNIFEGAFSGKVSLTSSMNFFEMYTPNFNTLPTNGLPVTLEFDYKTNETMLVGIYADTEQLSLVFINPTDDWNKIYINLTTIIGSRPNASNYKVYFGIFNSLTLPFLTSSPELYFDNMKIVHY